MAIQTHGRRHFRISDGPLVCPVSISYVSLCFVPICFVSNALDACYFVEIRYVISGCMLFGFDFISYVLVMLCCAMVSYILFCHIPF